MARQGWEEEDPTGTLATPEDAGMMPYDVANQNARIIDRENWNQKGPQGWSPKGTGYDIEHGRKVLGSSAYDKSIQNYRDQGAAAQGRAATQLDQGAANQSRGMQMGALGLMQTAAQGAAPSRAQALGTSATDTTTRQAVGNMAAARGPGAAVASSNAAGSAAADKMGQVNAQATDMRGSEMAKNQQDLVGSAGTMRGQDIGAATKNAQLQAYQNQLNESKQEGYENLGYDTRAFQGTTQIEADRIARAYGQQHQADADRRNAAKQADDRYYSGLVIEAGLTSDERAKQNIRPVTMGSLSGLSRFMHGRG